MVYLSPSTSVSIRWPLVPYPFQFIISAPATPRYTPGLESM
jgi:hypothetical protein